MWILKYILPLLLVIFASFYFFWPRVDISKYSGDGDIVKVGSAPISYGYFISLDKFLMDKEFSKSYKIDNFPKIKKTMVYGIKFTSNVAKLKDKLHGKLKMKAFFDDGYVLFETNDEIQNWNFSEKYLDNNEVEFFVSYIRGNGRSDIEFEKLQDANKINFSVSFSPAADNLPIQGELQVRVGGFY